MYIVLYLSHTAIEQHSTVQHEFFSYENYTKLHQNVVKESTRGTANNYYIHCIVFTIKSYIIYIFS